MHPRGDARCVFAYQENYVVSNAKVKKAMGVDKMPVTAREGLVKTIRSFSNL